MDAYNRRTNSESAQVGDYYEGSRRYYDQNFELTVIQLYSGDCYVASGEHELMVTILGSCVAACVRDPVAKVAGMNHFLLPGDPNASSNATGEGARYGAYAMEKLFNTLIAAGGRKDRFEVKLFGGGNVTGNSALIGTRNVAFIKDFMKREGLTVVASDLGGELPRRIQYFSADGRVMMRKLKRKEDMRVVAQEKTYQTTLAQAPVEGSVELFEW